MQVFQLSHHVTSSTMSSSACHQFVSPFHKLEFLHFLIILRNNMTQKQHDCLKKRLEKFFKLEEMKLTLRLTWKVRFFYLAHANWDNSRVTLPFDFFKRIKLKINFCSTRGVNWATKLIISTSRKSLRRATMRVCDNRHVSWRQWHPRSFPRWRPSCRSYWVIASANWFN